MTPSWSAPHHWRSDLTAILRFGSVGLLTTAVDIGVFSGLTQLMLPVLPANVTSYSLGITTSYALNRRFTFKADPDRLQALKFAIAMLAGLILSTCLVLLLNLFLPVVAAKLASVPIIFAWNYLTARLWVFKRRASQKSDSRTA